MTDDVLFFGVAAGTGAGHYLFTSPRPGSSCAMIRPEAVPDLPRELHRIDCVWTAPRPRTPEEVRDRRHGAKCETQGAAHIHYVRGWTVVAWWDRSEDPRGGSNANFLARGRRRFAEMLALAREWFPREMSRMERAYSIYLKGGDLPEAPVEDEAAAFAERFLREFDALHPDVRAAAVSLLARRLQAAAAHG